MIEVDRIPAHIKLARMGSGLSRKQVAQELGIHERTLSYWENGNTDIPVCKAVALANLYEMSIAELVGDVQFEAAMLDLKATNQRLKRMEEALERLERRD